MPPADTQVDGVGFRRWLELMGACSFALTQPILSIFGASTETFVYRGADRWDIVLFALVVAIMPACVLFALEVLVSVKSQRGSRALHTASIAILASLLAVFVIDDVAGANGVAALMSGGVAAVVTLLLRSRLGTFLRAGSATSAVFVLLFVFGSSVSPMVVGPQASGARLTGKGDGPIVVIVFDEWPTASIIDADGQVAASLFPNLARVAATSSWYRNTTSISNSTRYAVPAILTGRLQEGNNIPLVSSQPRNLFTMLASTHRMAVFESMTALCPDSICKRRIDSRIERLSGLFDDARGVVGDMISLAESRHDPTEQFVEPNANSVRAEDFFDLEPRQQRLARAVTNRPERYVEFLNSFSRGEEPTLHFIHLLMPHVPLRYLPSGLQYEPPNPEIGRQGDVWTDGPVATALAHQRALLQTAYLDGLIGILLDRLHATGLFESSTIVITADHGIAYEPGMPSRGLSDVALPEDTYAELLWVPFFVKAPGQERGSRSDVNVMTIDVLPTLAEAAGAEVPWEIDGLAAGARTNNRKVFQRAYSDTGGNRLDPPIDVDGTRHEAAMLDRSIDTVTISGDPQWQLWRLRPYGEHVGRALDSFTTGRPSNVRVELVQLRQLDHVDRASGTLPAMVWGTVDEPATIVISVNGTIAAMTPTYEGADSSQRFAAVLPEHLLQDGQNDVRVFLVEPADSAPVLREAVIASP